MRCLTPLSRITPARDRALPDATGDFAALMFDWIKAGGWADRLHSLHVFAPDDCFCGYFVSSLLL